MRTVSLLTLSLLASLVHADPSAMTQAKREASRFRASLVRKDFTTMDKEFAPDFTIVYPDGQKSTKAGFLADTKAFWGPLTIKSLKVTVPSAKDMGSAQVFVMDFMAEGTAKGKGPKPSVVKNHAVFELHRIEKGGAWLFDSGKCLKMDTTVDGKPMR